MTEEDRLLKDLAEMEAKINQTESALTEKIHKIKDLDSNLTELLKETNQQKEFKSNILKLQSNQRKVIKSFENLQTRLGDYKDMTQNVASTAIRLQIFVHVYILIVYY